MIIYILCFIVLSQIKYAIKSRRRPRKRTVEKKNENRLCGRVLEKAHIVMNRRQN